MVPPAPTGRSGLRGPATVAAAAQVFVDDLDSLELAQEDAHHLSAVLRLRRGEVVVASDGAGGWRVCRYRGRSGSATTGPGALEADGEACVDERPAPPLAVGFVPVKGERPEWVVQKLTEVGVDRIGVVRSARGVVRWEGQRAGRALARLRRVARQAAGQSRRAWLPEVVGVMSLDELDASVSPAKLALAHPGGGQVDRHVAALAVGPEGGWAEEELASGRRLVGLSTGILRAETAAIAAGLLLCSVHREEPALDPLQGPGETGDHVPSTRARAPGTGGSVRA